MAMIAALCCACTVCASMCIYEKAFTGPWLKRIEAALSQINSSLPDGVWFGFGQKLRADFGGGHHEIHPLLVFVGRNALPLSKSVMSVSDAPTNETMNRVLPRPTCSTVEEA
eukprot:4458430-Prymnesium_polylepis.1